MRIWAGCATVLFSISCASARPEVSPTPGPAGRPARPAAPATGPSANPQSPAIPAPAEAAALGDSVTRDSASLAAASRDSALDAAMLDRIAAAQPPATTELPAPPAEGESATLRSMFDIDVANFEDHGRVRFWVDFFSGPAKERMAIWLTRMPRYEPTIRALLVSRGLPGDLAYLPLIESGYSSTAVSRSRAVGMWQFMRPTGKFYGLTIDSWVDERRDVPKATDAAVRYLADLTKRFGSYYLAAAAYNGGPGRIGRGLRRMGTTEEAEEDDAAAVDDSLAADDGDMAFFQLADTRYIHQETKDYVPKLIAAAMIAKQPERYGFPVPMGGPPALDSVVLTEATGFDVIARLAGIPAADLREINPSYLRDLTPPKRTSVVRLPAGLGATTQAELDGLSASERLGSFPHRAKSGETLSSLGKRYGVALAAMRTANPDYAKKAPRKGEVVVIPGEARLKGWIAENRRVNTTEVLSGGTSHRVRRGETLGGIARRYRVSVAQLRGWNGLRSNSIRAGQLLRLRPGTPRKASTRTSSVPGARVHLVRAGDTLSSIARRYRTTVQALRDANHLSAGRILAGQRLKIPS